MTTLLLYAAASNIALLPCRALPGMVVLGAECTGSSFQGRAFMLPCGVPLLQKASSIAASVLVRAAVDRGSRDNVTVVIVDLSPATPEELEEEARKAEVGAMPAWGCGRLAVWRGSCWL